MSKGFLVVAQNSQGIDYVRQAYFLAKSLQISQKKYKNISILTNDVVPDEYKSAFDQIISIPFGDHAQHSEWKVENRWKVYYSSPYYETIVFDADMLVTTDLSNCWKFAEDKDLFFTSVVKNYKGNIITDNTYRKTFVENNLPNLYSGMFYFKKSEKVQTFFKVLEYVVYNWERFFFEITPKNYQKFFSLDVATAITAKILDMESEITHPLSPFQFVHMKPYLQEWAVVPGSCYSKIYCYFNSKKELYVGNYKQLGVFHYVEDSFLTKDITENLNG